MLTQSFGSGCSVHLQRQAKHVLQGLHQSDRHHRQQRRRQEAGDVWVGRDGDDYDTDTDDVGNDMMMLKCICC